MSNPDFLPGDATESEPSVTCNTEFRRDVSLSYNRLGDVQLQLGDTAQALGFYEKALAVAEELVKLDLANTQFRRDVWASLWRFGDLEEKLGNKAAAKDRFTQVIERLQEMKRLGILAPVDEEWIGKAESRRAALQ